MPENEATATDHDEAPDTLRALPTTTQARTALDGVVDALGADEVCVLVRIAERLKEGAWIYGTLRVAYDSRAFRSKEAREEIEDALGYLACAWLKTQVQEVNP